MEIDRDYLRTETAIGSRASQEHYLRVLVFLALRDDGYGVAHCAVYLFTPRLSLVLIVSTCGGWPGWVSLGGWLVVVTLYKTGYNCRTKIVSLLLAQRRHCMPDVFAYTRLVLKDYHRCGLLTLFIVWIAAMLGILYQYAYHER